MADAKIPPADPKETAVALKGLAPSVNEAALSTMFAPHGKVLRMKLDGHSGAHVVFGSTRAAQRAAAALNGAVVQGQKIAAQHVRTFAKTTRPCRGFQEGKCRKGDQCKYWHPTDGATPTAAPSAPPTVAAKSKSTTKAAAPVIEEGDDISGIPKASICRNFAKGKCLQGVTCRFAHVLGAGELPPPPPASIPAPCSFYAAGRCAKGDDCAFLHTDRPLQPPASKPTMCSFFAAGRCARGDQCAYLHETKTAAPVAAPTAPAVKQPVAKVVKTTTKAAPVKKSKPAVATPLVADSDRTCIECEQPAVATWVCAGCDNAKYCDECTTLVHRPKVMRSHAPAPLPVVAPVPTCTECEAQPASVECSDCGVEYCASCDASVHQFKSLRNHARLPLASGSPVVAATKAKTEKQPKDEKKPKAEAAAKQPMTYIDSVPQYDLPSDSESSDDDEDEYESPQPNSVPHTSTAQDSSSESDDEEESPAAAAMKAVTAASSGYVASVPKYDLSSESESSSDDNEDGNDSVEEVKQSIVKAAVVAVKQKIASPAKSAPRADASDSDDDDFEDERPVLTTATPAPAKQGTKALAITTISSESESESDDDDGKPVTKTVAPKRKALASSSSSESDSSEDDDVPPPAKQQRVTAKAPAPAPRTQNQEVGISTGSSHSLVKTIEAYAESDNTEVLHLDPNLNGFERLLAHDCAERLGLEHVSVGEGLERHITVSRKGTNKRTGPTANGANKKQKRT